MEARPSGPFHAGSYFAGDMSFVVISGAMDLYTNGKLRRQHLGGPWTKTLENAFSDY